MEEKQKSSADQSQGLQQNPTLNEKGTKVPDYGNVMGGSADTNVEQGQQPDNRRETNTTRSENADTMGNP